MKSMEDIVAAITEEPTTKVIEETVVHRHKRESEFRPGVYRHYKGGLYNAVAIGWMQEVANPRMRGVIYVSMTTGDWHVRPYNSITLTGLDAWNDFVWVETALPEGEPSVSVPRWEERFRYVGVQAILPAR
jgi:hypothetical protein